MPLFTDFCGGMYQARSPLMGADNAVNVYLETREVPGSPKQTVLYGTPGLVSQATVGTTDGRGWFTQDGRTWVVMGDTLYERINATTYTSRGTIPDDGQLVSFASNGAGGDQLGIVGGGALNVLDLNTNTLTSVVLPFTGPVMMTFQNGYGLINQADSPIVWFSALEDFTSWDPLDFFARSGTSDNIIAIAVSRDRVWCIGSKTTTLFYDSGDADTPFLPYPGTTVQTGIACATALVVYNDVLAWVAVSARGLPYVVMATEGAPTVISTPPIDLFLQGCTSVEDIEGLVYQQDGHVFMAWTCPSATQADGLRTPCYDLTEQRWHFRASWDEDSGSWRRWRVRTVTTVGTEVLAADYNTGTLYELSLDAYDENGVTMPAERTAPYLADQNQWLFIDQIELGMQAGVGLVTGQGSDPQVELWISRDGAQTWTSAGYAYLGALGSYLTRAIWRRLGRARSDRLVLKIRQSDPVKRVWGPGLWITATPGSGQL